MLDSLASELTMEGGSPLPIKGLHHKFPSAIDIDVIDKQVSKLHFQSHCRDYRRSIG